MHAEAHCYTGVFQNVPATHFSNTDLWSCIFRWKLGDMDIHERQPG